MSTVTSAIEHIGLTKLANRFGYYPSAVQKWRDDGRLPKSELAGLTAYASVIAEMTDGQYPALKLISDSRERWIKPVPRKKKKKKSKAGV